MKYNPKIVIAYWKELGIPIPQIEYKFHGIRKWKFDFAWPAPSPETFSAFRLNLALEVEGGIWTGGRHTSSVGFIKDMEKYNAAAALGWRILRCQPKDLCTLDLAEQITRAL